MYITRNPEDFVTPLPVIATKEYFQAVGAIDYGYMIDQGMVLPFYIKKKLFFRIMVFTTGILGPIAGPEKEKRFLNTAVKHIREKLNVDFINPLHVTALFNTKPDGSVFCRFGSYVIDLNTNEDTLFANLHPKHRNVIKKALKDGVVIRCSAEKRKHCIKLIQDTLIRQGQPEIPSTWLDGLDKNLTGNIDYWIAEYQEEYVGAAILVWSKAGYSYYLYGGSARTPHSGAMNLLHWEAIKKMKARGVLFYDFVGARINPETGSKYEGIQRFKSRFGGPLQTGYLWKVVFHPFYYSLYTLLVKLKSRVKHSNDIIEQERERGKR